MGSYSSTTFLRLQEHLIHNCTGLPNGFIPFLINLMNQSELQNTFSKPMVWIGIYIAIASLLCILPMLADLLHGFKTKKLWFPCKYFTLNAASLTVMAVAMKLPMDLNNSMPNNVDQAAKLGSLVFMCTMMANLLPSLATMDNKELLTNIIALGVLVITVVVNVCIQIHTGVVSNYLGYYSGHVAYKNWLIALIYVALLLMLLMIHACSALMILKSKQILESKYKEGHETSLKELELQQPTVEKLKHHVRNHWIMAETGSPQFMTVCSATTCASGVICFLTTIQHVIIMLFTRPYMKYYGSDYKWSVIAILITQFTGIIVGTIAPLFRCFASLGFNLSTEWVWNHIRVYKVDGYYTQKLSAWKQSSIPFKLHSRGCKIVIHDLKVLILSLCIIIQKTIVVACKMIALIPIFFVIGALCGFHCWKWLKAAFDASYNEPVTNPAQLQHSKDPSQYVLFLQDDMELAERTLTSISKSVNHVIQKAKKKRPNNLMTFLEEFSGFEGVGKYDVHPATPLPKGKYVDCWSLPVVTLTAIAISLPNIQNNMVYSLLRSVSEGLTYIKHVEETLNASDDYIIIQKVARTLWLEIEVYDKWLGKKLSDSAHQFNTTKEIVQSFSDTAKNMVTEVQSENMKGSNDNLVYMSVSAYSMYQITQTILVSYDVNIDQIDQEELFMKLSSMISHILAACFTNLPQVIAMKCHMNAIEKREESVLNAAQLLGETMEIINSLQDRELPSLNPDELPYIDKWRDYFLHPSS